MPPKRPLMKNVVSDGIKTMVMPLMAPGRDRGRMTLVKVCQELAPRSRAAAMTLRLILLKDT